MQRPLWRAWQQDPGRVPRWKEDGFPRLQALAKRMAAKIDFTDESGVRSDFRAGTTWGKCGTTPVVDVTAGQFSLDRLRAVSRNGSLRFMGTDQNVWAAVFSEFVDRLIQDQASPVIRIVDHHPRRRAAKGRRHMAKHGGRLLLYFLPPCSPQ